MDVLGEVFTQVMAFSTGLLVLAAIVLGIMRLRRHDPFTDTGVPNRRSMFQWLYPLFMSLMLFTFFLDRLLPRGLVPLQAAYLLRQSSS